MTQSEVKSLVIKTVFMQFFHLCDELDWCFLAVTVGALHAV